MACWNKHKIACKTLLGNSFKEIHEMMDKVGEGERYHRVEGHDMLWICAIVYEIKNNLNLSPEDTLGYLKAGIIHLVQDYGVECIEEIESFFTEVLNREINLKNLLDLPDNWFDSICNLIVELFGNICIYKGESLKIVITGECLDEPMEYSNVYKVIMYDKDGRKIGRIEDRGFIKINVSNSLIIDIFHKTSKFLDNLAQEKLIKKYERENKDFDKFLPLITACNYCRRRENCPWI